MQVNLPQQLSFVTKTLGDNSAADLTPKVSWYLSTMYLLILIKNSNLIFYLYAITSGHCHKTALQKFGYKYKFKIRSLMSTPEATVARNNSEMT